MPPTEPETAEALMRSRFAAYASGDLDWLRHTWHPKTLPVDLELDDSIRWRGVQVVDTVAGAANDTDGVVEFRATYLLAGDFGVLHERSRFVRHQGRWVYYDGHLVGD